MKLCFALLISLTIPLAASAAQPDASAQSIQSVESCLRSLFDRMANIRNEQRALNKKLDDASLTAEDKARVQADYQALEIERKRIEKVIMRAA